MGGMQYLFEFMADENVRISYEDKWLIWDKDHWLVLQRPPYKKVNRCLYDGKNFEEALTALEGR